MEYAYENLVDPQNVASGIAELILLAPVKSFETDGIKTPVAPFTEPGDEITIKDAHVFKSGKAFTKFQLAPQKNSLNIGTHGEVGLLGQNQEATIFIPGNYAQAHETVKHLLNTPLIALVKDSNCAADLWMQLGCDCQFAWINPNFTTGTSKDGVKGYEVKVTYDGGPQIYSVAGGPEIQDDGSDS
jgi:hypothetical protein